jgi:hypothetical protein
MWVSPRIDQRDLYCDTIWLNDLLAFLQPCRLGLRVNILRNLACVLGIKCSQCNRYIAAVFMLAAPGQIRAALPTEFTNDAAR